MAQSQKANEIILKGHSILSTKTKGGKQCKKTTQTHYFYIEKPSSGSGRTQQHFHITSIQYFMNA